MARPALQLVSNPKHWKVMVAPVRLEIIEAMRMIAPCSVADIAAALDRPADALYRHIEQLVKARAVVVSGERLSGRRMERLYDLVADDFSIGFADPSGRQANEAYRDTVASIAKILVRTSRDASKASLLVGGGEVRNIVALFEHAWLTPDEFTALRVMLLKVKSYLDAHKTPGNGSLYVVGELAVPVARKRGARTRAKTAAAPARAASRSSGRKPRKN